MFKPYRWKDPIQQRNCKRLEFVALFHWIAGAILFLAIFDYKFIGISVMSLGLVLDLIAWKIQDKDKKSK